MAQKEQGLYSVEPESMRYNKYEARMQVVGRMLDGIRRHKLLVAFVTAAVVALVLCFLGLIGMQSGEAKCADFVYGEEPPCSVKAFLSDLKYQYTAAEGTADWSDRMPSLPGKYRIRAVSRNGFGKPVYSDEMVFTLLKRDLTVRINNGTFVYGEFSAEVVTNSTTTEGLASSDKIAHVEYAFTEDEQGNYTASVKMLRIENGAGQDTTACYNVAVTDGYMTKTPRAITVSAENGHKVYDGKAWNAGTAKLTAGTLAYQDTLHITVSPAPAEAGTYTLIPSCTVRNGEGQDVTDCYAITVQKATLTVERRPISVQTGSASKVYDATPLTCSQWSVADGEVVEGHTLVGLPTGSRTEKGESANTIKLVVQDANGTDVSSNYIFSVEEGRLNILPVVLKFETHSAEKVYDGTMLSSPGHRLVSGKLVKGHTLQMMTYFVQIEVGSCENKLTVKILDQNGVNVTDAGYEIQVDTGTLTVTPRPITVRSGSAEKLYDGTPLTYKMFEVVEGSLAPGEYFGSRNFTGSQTAVGSSGNWFTMGIRNNKKDTTRNYKITYEYGTLTVHENPDIPEEGKPNTGNDGEVGGDENDKNSSGESGLPERDKGTEIGFPKGSKNTLYAKILNVHGLNDTTRVYFRDTCYGDYTGTGWEVPNIYPGGNEMTNPQWFVGRSLNHAGAAAAYMRINRINDCPMIIPYFTSGITGKGNDCYIESGDYSYYLPVYAGLSYFELKDTAVAAGDEQYEEAYRKFVYQEYLQIPQSTRNALLQWAKEQGISADSKTLVDDIRMAILLSTEYNADAERYPEGVDVAVHFLTEAKEGICQHFASAATLLYRAYGIPARYTVGFSKMLTNGKDEELTAGDSHAWVEIYVDGLGWVPVEVTAGSSIPSAKRDLHIMAYSATKYYDGKGFENYDLEQFTLLSGKLDKNHRLEITIRAAWNAGAPGEYNNRIVSCVIYDENGKNVTNKYYNVYLYDGKLEILPRKITVTTGSASKIYDGTPLTCPDYWISQGGLAPGEKLAVELDGSLVEPGAAQNSVSQIKVFHEDSYGQEIDVTGYYDITVIPGSLTVTEAEMPESFQPATEDDWE